MLESELLTLFDREQRREVDYPGMRRETTAHVVRHVPLGSTDDEAFISYSNLAGVDVETAIREQITYFDSLGLHFEWKAYEHDQPANLHERLGENGFEVEDPEAVMVLELAEAPETLWQPVLHDVRRISDPADLVDVIAVEESVWNTSFTSLAHGLAAELRRFPDRISVFVAYIGERPASCAWIRYHPPSQFAGLWGGSTLAEYRGQGLYKSLLAARGQEARSRGVALLTVDASPMSQPILERLGFRRITSARACKWRGARHA